MRDYLPYTDNEFDNWQRNFLSALDARRDALGFSAAEFAALAAAAREWEQAFAAQQAARAAAAAATNAKAGALERYRHALRTAVVRLQPNPGLEDRDRVALGITVRSNSRAKAPAPSSSPVAHVDVSQRFRHVINFADDATPTRRGKPAGVRGCEIWVKVGDPPADASECRLLAFAFSSPHVADYGGAEAGLTAHYLLRWVNTRGTHGPWGRTVSATVQG